MEAVDTVIVYSFHLFGADPEDFELAPFKATREAIAGLYGGRVLEGTAEHVDVGALDRQGRYRRVATGWGELV